MLSEQIGFFGQNKCGANIVKTAAYVADVACTS